MGRSITFFRLGQWAVVAVEVKKDDADSAVTDKQLGYKNSISENLAFQDKKKAFVLLVSRSSDDVVHSFDVRCYPEFCRNLRRLATSWMHSALAEDTERGTGNTSKLFAASITLMVAAAIETNLLGFSVHESSFTPATLAHLKEFLERDGYE